MGGGGVVSRNIRKIEAKLPKPVAEKITKKVTKTAKNRQLSLKVIKNLKPLERRAKMPTNICKFEQNLPKYRNFWVFEDSH